MKTDRELVEYLDESVCLHEDIKVHIRTIVTDEPVSYQCCKCERIWSAKEQTPYPTPTLEWMAEGLRKKGHGVHLGIATVAILMGKGHENDIVVFYSDKVSTQTLALRGAVCKMIESEEGKV